MMMLVDRMKATGRRPRLHPNGFIQFDVTPSGDIRFHVWPDEKLKAQQTRHPIHDHIFDMRSFVLCGAITNLTYEFLHNSFGTYDTVLHRAVATANPNDTVLQPITERAFGNLECREAVVCRAGRSYSLKHGLLHDSVPHGLTATVMVKQAVFPGRPLIAVPRGVAPDNAFNRETIEAGVLWDVIEKAQNRIVEVLRPENYTWNTLLRIMETQ